MWTRTYLLLMLVRLYFALSPSYIHPDENFQGPEVIAGKIFNFPNLLTWEFTSNEPVRSVFPLWPTYGVPMVVLRWLWTGTSTLSVPPCIVYYTLRLVMFIASFVLEDWAIHELVESPRQRRLAVILVASSYVTWTYQTHTFSNSVETIVVLWSLALIQRIRDAKKHSSILSSSILGVIGVFGTFNRITFPAYVLAPMLSLLPHFARKPLTPITIAISASLTLIIAIQTDTTFFRGAPTISTLFHSPVLAPFNALRYNLSRSNLAEHGLHPHYTHILGNTPLLLAPALPLLLRNLIPSTRLTSALSGLLVLSLLPHQEARFLLPLVPLLLSSLHLPRRPLHRRLFLAIWLLFNVTMGLLMGTFHQAGVVPIQLRLGQLSNTGTDLLSSGDPALASATINKGKALGPGSRALWWKTYSPPVWLLDAEPDALETVDLMGMPAENTWTRLLAEISASCTEQHGRIGDVVLVAPNAVDVIRDWQGLAAEGGIEAESGIAAIGRRERDTNGTRLQWPGATELIWTPLLTEWRHIGLDDLDFAGHGVLGTLAKVVRTRGLTAWRVKRRCPPFSDGERRPG